MSQYLSLARGTVVSADDKPKMQTLTIRDQYGDKATDVEHWQPAGFVSVPMPPKDGKEAEVIIGYVGGQSEHPIILGTADRRTRPTGAKPGDTILYDPRDNRRRMTFGQDGSLQTSMPKGGKIIHQIGDVKLSLSESGLDVTGGYIKHNGKRIDAQHKHADVQPGAGQTGFPLAAVAVLVGADLVVRLIGIIAGIWA